MAVSITDGEWVITLTGGPFGRFTLNSGDVVAIDGRYDFGPSEPLAACGSPQQCVAGEVVGLSSSFGNEQPITVETFASGTAVVGARSYSLVEFGGQIELLGDRVTLPAPPGIEFPERVTASGRFTLTGDLKGFDVLQRRDPKLQFDLPIVGHGTATLELLTNRTPGGPTMSFFQLRYVFEP